MRVSQCTPTFHPDRFQIFYYFGGDSVYYLGFYSYGTSITTPSERATRLARFDGAEQLGILLGTFLSPIILYSVMGYYGVYGFKERQIPQKTFTTF
jgi:hypothetical protein